MSFEEVGKQFVQHYYQTFDNNRGSLAPLYSEHSMMSFEGEQFQGAQNIAQKLAGLPFQKVQHTVVCMDCQPNPATNGVVIFVTGNLLVDDNTNPLKFGQVFQLAPNPNGQGYFCKLTAQLYLPFMHSKGLV